MHYQRTRCLRFFKNYTRMQFPSIFRPIETSVFIKNSRKMDQWKLTRVRAKVCISFAILTEVLDRDAITRRDLKNQFHCFLYIIKYKGIEWKNQKSIILRSFLKMQNVIAMSRFVQESRWWFLKKANKNKKTIIAILFGPFKNIAIIFVRLKIEITVIFDPFYCNHILFSSLKLFQ